MSWYAKSKSLKSDDKLSTKIKAALFKRFRFELNYSLCASEVNFCGKWGIEDFVAAKYSKNTELIFVEVKISKSDFLADFKKPKHRLIPTASKCQKFYYCVSENIAEFALDYLKANYPAYGLMVYKDSEISVIKNAKNLKTPKTSSNLPMGYTDIHLLLLRMGSELASLRQDI